ncbi:MAG TPA: HipA N-terminal domain-containing protein [Oleiagrimonas sp.]|nr:HipA N-terminal domain-containing protein [Oleiagrimonas sp.]
MARRIKALDIWMNGHRVGQWDRHRTGTERLTYDPTWMTAPYGRPFSLSLPYSTGQAARESVSIHGDAVQILPAGQAPDAAETIDARPLDETEVAKLLRDAFSTDRWTAEETEAFRLSIAGARCQCALSTARHPPPALAGDGEKSRLDGRGRNDRRPRATHARGTPGCLEPPAGALSGRHLRRGGR